MKSFLVAAFMLVAGVIAQDPNCPADCQSPYVSCCTTEGDPACKAFIDCGHEVANIPGDTVNCAAAATQACSGFCFNMGDVDGVFSCLNDQPGSPQSGRRALPIAYKA